MECRHGLIRKSLGSPEGAGGGTCARSDTPAIISRPMLTKRYPSIVAAGNNENDKRFGFMRRSKRVAFIEMSARQVYPVGGACQVLEIICSGLQNDNGR